jgi:outer membrane protein
MSHVSGREYTSLRWGLIPMLLLASGAPAAAQSVPASPDHPLVITNTSELQSEIAGRAAARPQLLPAHAYSLAELIDIAEQNNPETRVSWEQAKANAAQLGIARSALYPTLAAMASASASRYSLFFGKFYREDIELFPATLNLSYTLLDFGARAARIDAAKANLLAADLVFNDTHRKVIFDVTQAYYQLLDAKGHEAAAQATLTDARTLQQALEDRLARGLATLPDVLEARAATAQAEYELASVQGQETVSRAILASVLGIDGSSSFDIEDLPGNLPSSVLNEPVQNLVQRALAQRPDLLAQAAQVKAADAEIREARSSFFPTISLDADAGHSYGIGQQVNDPVAHSQIYPYTVQLKLSWTLFDGDLRANELARAESNRRKADAELTALIDKIENEISTSYARLKTAQRQQQAADALLAAATTSYTAASEAFQSGVRNFIDVTQAQRDLARARTAQISARTELLTAAADLAFRAGSLVETMQSRPGS